MVSQDDSPERLDSEFRLKRTPRTNDLPSLLSKYGDAGSGDRAWRPWLRCSTNSASENSDILYMAVPRTRGRLNHSLSLISNNYAPRFDRLLEGDGVCNDTYAQEDSAEHFSWGIIDREIYEWQYVCRTGCPYWWSPRAKYSRLNMARSELGYVPKTHIWVTDADEQPKDEYNARRRAVSDSFLTDPSTVGDMAHMIAVQLLSSCFTLAPNLAVPASSQNCSFSGKKRSINLSILDSPMISSLRMHTRYRYSPCFGHQGRSTSPMHPWPCTYDGPTSSSPSPSPTTDMQTPDIGTSDTVLRRRRVHRALHVTEGSATSCSLGSHADEFLNLCTNANLDPAVGETRPSQQPLRKDAKSEDHISHRLEMDKEAGQETATDTLHQARIGTSESHYTRPKPEYELDLVTRSEPYHGFVQPVKELVTKKWQNLRRRLGSSSHSTCSLPATRLGEISPASSSRASSPAGESDRKERRRRAQASGDISSYESTPHYNSPASHLSPTGSGASSPLQTDQGTVATGIALAESLDIAISSTLESDLEDIAPGHDPAFHNASHTLETCQGCQPHNSAERDPSDSMNCHSIVEAGHKAQPMPNSIALSQPSIRSRSRQRRKSMLSEVFNAEDLADETTINRSNDEVETNISSEMNKAQAVPSDETEPTSNILPLDSNSDVSSTATRKPRLSRTSTNGTQVFSPSDEGVEIDGLPVGLCRHAWNGPGKRRERSFL